MIFYLLTLLLIIILYRLKIKYESSISHLKKYGNKIPGPKPLPLIGNVLEIKTTSKGIFQYFKQLTRKYGPISRIWIGPKLLVMLADPPIVEAVLSKNLKSMKKASFYRAAEQVAGKGLVFSSGDVWKTHRRLIAPTFNTRYMEWYVQVFNSNLDVLVDLLSKRLNGPDIDISPLMSMFALDVICESAVDWKMNAMLNPDYDLIKSISSIEEIIFRRMFQPLLYPNIIFKLSPLGRKMARCIETIDAPAKRVIETRIQEIKNSANKEAEDPQGGNGSMKKMAILDQLLFQAMNGANFDDKDIMDELNTIVSAGQDTTANALGFTCWLLAKHQDIQDKVSEELRTVFGDSMRHVTRQDLAELKYLEQVIKETLRLYPPGPLIGRQLMEDLIIDNYIIPAGTEVGINVYMLHRHPHHFPDPERFDPDRFLPENCAKRHPYAYIPFSAGPRNCVGLSFAMHEMKITMATLLRHFEFFPPENPFLELDLCTEMILKSQNGVYIKIQPRRL